MNVKVLPVKTADSVVFASDGEERGDGRLSTRPKGNLLLFAVDPRGRIRLSC